MESKLKKLPNGDITEFAKETAQAMMQAMGQAKLMGLLKTDDDMLDLMAVGMEEAFTILIERMEEPEEGTESKIIL
jgi:translation elongation factor P/translation initiation factor 5A